MERKQITSSVLAFRSLWFITDNTDFSPYIANLTNRSITLHIDVTKYTISRTKAFCSFYTSSSETKIKYFIVNHELTRIASLSPEFRF